MVVLIIAIHWRYWLILISLGKHYHIAFGYLALRSAIPYAVQKIRRPEHADGVLKLPSVAVRKPDKVQGHSLHPSPDRWGVLSVIGIRPTGAAREEMSACIAGACLKERRLSIEAVTG